MTGVPVQIRMNGVWFDYGGRTVLRDIRTEIRKNTITALSGPSGQGKSSFLMILNRLWENVESARMQGRVEIDFGNGFEDIYADRFPLHELRRRVGTVFQVPNPLPMSIFKNVAFPLKLRGEKDMNRISARVESALKSARLWEEVRERLSENAQALSGGQQQRLCIARALILEPMILLLDEPTSSLDEISVQAIENLLLEIKSRCTIILVTHYMDQIRRIADHRLVLSNGQIHESPERSTIPEKGHHHD